MRAALGQLCLQIAALALFGAASLAAPAPAPLIEQGRAAMGRGDDDAAIEILLKAVAESPNSAKAHFYLGTAYGSKAQKGGMIGAMSYATKLKDEFAKAVELDPKYVEARFALVQIYAATPAMMGGSFDEALAQATAIKAIDPILGHRAFAVVYTQQKKLDLAKKEYLDAIAEHPDSAKVHSYFGQYLVSVEKNYPAAFAEFDAALKVDPNYMAAFYHLGRTAALADTNLARGEASLKKYLGYTPKENEPALARANYYLGSIYEKEGKKAEAKQSYQTALKLNPTLTDASEALKRMP